MPVLSRSRRPGSRDERPDSHEQTGAEAVCERAEAARESECDQRHWERRQPCLHGAVPRDLLQEDGEKEEEDGESPTYMASVSRFPTAKFRRLNRSSFSIGSRARHS